MDSGSDLQSECDLPRRAVTEPASEIEYTIHLPRVRAVTVPTDGAAGATAQPRPVSSTSLVDSERDLPLRAVTEPVEHVSLFFTAGLDANDVSWGQPDSRGRTSSNISVPRQMECSPCDRDQVSRECDAGYPTVQEGEAKYYQGSQRTARDGAIHCEGFTTRNELTQQVRGLCLVLVGLPGRGKSFISRKTEGFLKWQNMRTKTFNVGKYRRDLEGAVESGRADFFDTQNKAAMAARTQAAVLALNDTFQFLDDGGDVAIFDATNTTDERRTLIIDHSRMNGRKYRVVFIEIICDDPEVLLTNFRNKVLHSPDFAGLSLEEGLADLMKRVKKYEEQYEPIENDNLSYIKLYNMSSKVLVNRIYGSVAKSLMPYLMGIHIGTRPIWLSRAGHVPPGGQQDRSLTQEGHKFAMRLGAFVRRRVIEFHGADLPEKPMRVLSSTVPSAVQTVMATLQAVPGFSRLAFKPTSSLSPIDRGRLHGPWWVDKCTDLPPWDELKKIDKDFHAKFVKDPLRTRFPGGESYYDVINRVETCLLEIEMTTRPILCVAHTTVLQVLLSYFMGTAVGEAWNQPFPQNCVAEITPTLGGSFQVEMVNIDNEPLFDASLAMSRKKQSREHVNKGNVRQGQRRQSSADAGKSLGDTFFQGRRKNSDDGTYPAPAEASSSDQGSPANDSNVVRAPRPPEPRRQVSLTIEYEESRLPHLSPEGGPRLRFLSEGDEPDEAKLT